MMTGASALFFLCSHRVERVIECLPASIQTGSTVHFPRLRPEMLNALLAARACHDSFTGVTCFLSAEGFRCCIREAHAALRNARRLPRTKRREIMLERGVFLFRPSLRYEGGLSLFFACFHKTTHVHNKALIYDAQARR